MTFRRLRKVNSGSPAEGGGPSSSSSSCQHQDLYSSQGDHSCRTVDLRTNSSDVYNYKTLAYSGGTLPRTKKVRN